MPAPVLPDYRQHLEVETPEHIVLDYEIAGLGSRALAAIADTAILGLWTLAVVIVIGSLETRAEIFGRVFMTLVLFVSYWGYFTLFEGLRRGQTPGKRMVGIRVVRDTGHPVTFGASAARNLLRVADALPPPYFLGGLLVALHPRAKRLGDMVAGTVVVRDRPMEATAPEPAADLAEEELGVPELSEEEFRLLREYQDRAASLDVEVRNRLAERLAARFAARFPARTSHSGTFLGEVFRLESARRRSRFAGRSRDGGGTGARLVARKRERWTAFERMADRAARAGLDSFKAEELPDFAARYREVAADLARARTYKAEPAVQARLERLVAAGHNALYRDERSSYQRVWAVLARECPAAVLQARRAVLLANLLFWLPAGAGFLLIREDPALAQTLLPETMLRRAEAGSERVESGKGYVEVEARVRPAIASGIIANNIGVAFNCFAGGIFLGVGSLLLLAFNGLSLGLSAAHFANHGLLIYLLTFIVGHGLLELFAITVSGAAGFLLGKALIAPGDLTRAEALVLSGRQAVRMVGFVMVLLIVAGTIEGMVSTSGLALTYRLAVSASSGVFLVLYLVNGARFLGVQGRTP